MKVPDDINVSVTSFCEKYLKPKNRKYLEDILKGIQDAVLPSGQCKPDEAEIMREEIYGWELYIPDMDFESEVYYQWEEDIADDAFRRSWERRVEEARDKRELRREEKMKERWKIIMEKAIDFAIAGPSTDFNFKRCRSQSC